MIVVGYGFRSGATSSSLKDALDLCAVQPDAIATPADKVDNPILQDFAQSQNLSLLAVPLADLRAQVTATIAPNQPARYGCGSVAEAAALAAAGPNAQLIVSRMISPDSMATIAVAKGPDT